MSGIDRGALERILDEARYSRGNQWTTAKLTDAILALVQPPGSGTLTREEEAPVPPLPTEPYTVIRAEAPAFEAEMILTPLGTWRTISGNLVELTPAQAAARLTSFEVLSEPRQVTAAAVLDEVRNTVGAHMDYIDPAILAEVGAEFGVES